MIGHRGGRVQVRMPGGGLVWEVPPCALRPALGEEREAMRFLANSDAVRPSPEGVKGGRRCEDCDALSAAWRSASVAGQYTDTAVDALIRFRNHWRLEHGAPA
ncbi:hypothetical protein [Streptomyces eurocidicus]|uniref:Uncharacterized protein n=1 Tax=Streptomyces eurocidicus TaxID=66423 RepID=A0A7W8F655_STREU|nr:hypothetical protein [Streptomyces eurocidicus]MBB5122809.1 hypothetical protein [Streptomyces eurocidicus]